MLEPTELAKELGIASAIAMNRVLCHLGLQTRTKAGWQPTARAEKFCTKHAWKNGNKSGYNLKWNLEFVRLENRKQK